MNLATATGDFRFYVDSSAESEESYNVCETVTKLVSPSIELKQQAVDLLYETGKYILES